MVKMILIIRYWVGWDLAYEKCCTMRAGESCCKFWCQQTRLITFVKKRKIKEKWSWWWETEKQNCTCRGLHQSMGRIWLLYGDVQLHANLSLKAMLLGFGNTTLLLCHLKWELPFLFATGKRKKEEEKRKGLKNNGNCHCSSMNWHSLIPAETWQSHLVNLEYNEVKLSGMFD